MPVFRGPLFPTGPGHATVERRAPSPAASGLVRHYWTARWEVPGDAAHERRALSYPSCSLVVEIGATADRIGTLFGPATGLTSRRLVWTGAAFGVRLQPAAGALLSDVALPGLVDSSRPGPVIGFTAGPDVAAALAAPGADGAGAVQEAAALFEAWLARRLPAGADEEGLLANRIADAVEDDDGGALRVVDLAERFGLSERGLRRLVRARIGPTATWLIRRRRLRDAARALDAGRPLDLGALLAELDYANPARFARDFAAVTGLTPAAYQRLAGAGTAPSPAEA